MRVPAEIALVFCVFFIQGAYPVPDVNEPYYLGKAIHRWNPDWAPGDFFLDTADAHHVFNYTFGWLSLWLSPVALAWCGRILTWGLLAWAWQRLSYAVVPRPWLSILTAALLVALIDRCNMAGEWIVGGVEAKGFAYVLVFLGLEALVRDRWNRAWLLLGAASAFHVLVGGWSVVAAALVWLFSGGLSRFSSDENGTVPLRSATVSRSPALRSMWPGLVGGFLLSLPGMVPALLLNWGADPQVLRQANLIYVYHRLYHHLDPAQFPRLLVTRFVLLCLVWLLLCELTSGDRAWRRLRAFVGAALGIALMGAAIRLLGYVSRPLAASLLRFYWFRLADVAVPMGVALMGTSAAVWALQFWPAAARRWLVVATVLGALHVGAVGWDHLTPQAPRADRMPHYFAWREACDFVAQPPEENGIPRNARFLTPRMAQTFKWYTGRSEVANWKEIPQAPGETFEWWRRMRLIYGNRDDPEHPWYESLKEVDPDRLQ